MLGEGDKESEVKGLTMTPEVLNPSPEGFSTTFLHISHHSHSALPSHPPPSNQFPQYAIPSQAAVLALPAPTGGQDDLILHFIRALDRLAQNTTPAPPAQVNLPIATQVQAQAPNTF